MPGGAAVASHLADVVAVASRHGDGGRRPPETPARPTRTAPAGSPDTSAPMPGLPDDTLLILPAGSADVDGSERPAAMVSPGAGLWHRHGDQVQPRSWAARLRGVLARAGQARALGMLAVTMPRSSSAPAVRVGSWPVSRLPRAARCQGGQLIAGPAGGRADSADGRQWPGSYGQHSMPVKQHHSRAQYWSRPVTEPARIWTTTRTTSWPPTWPPARNPACVSRSSSHGDARHCVLTELLREFSQFRDPAGVCVA